MRKIDREPQRLPFIEPRWTPNQRFRMRQHKLIAQVVRCARECAAAISVTDAGFRPIGLARAAWAYANEAARLIEEARAIPRENPQERAAAWRAVAERTVVVGGFGGVASPIRQVATYAALGGVA